MYRVLSKEFQAAHVDITGLFVREDQPVCAKCLGFIQNGNVNGKTWGLAQDVVVC
jgi:hypothetical protein